MVSVSLTRLKEDFQNSLLMTERFLKLAMKVWTTTRTQTRAISCNTLKNGGVNIIFYML